MRWQDECFNRAACKKANPEIFYLDTAEAKKICKECPVRTECARAAQQLEAETGERFGVWGGMSVRERERAFG